MADAYEQPDAEGEGEAPADDGAFDEALEVFHTICTAQQEERALSLQDRRFVSIAGAQWEGQWGVAFENSIMVEVDHVGRGTQKIVDDYRAHRLTVEYRPVSSNPADQETADTLNGVFLADVYASKGQQAFDGGFEEGVQGGMGAWRLKNVYVDEYDPDDDSQRIAFEWIPDADQSVFFDMEARLYDKSDARFCFVITAMTPAAYKATYDDDPASWPAGLLKPHYDWYTPDVVRVAEYYRKIEETEDRLTFEHTVTGDRQKLWRSDLEPGAIKDMQTRGWRQMGRKPVKRCRVEKLTFSLIGEIAERQIIAGTEIPVVPYYGKRWFVDNMERWRGNVRPSKDAQRIHNTQLARLVETSAYAPIERPYFTPEQVRGHETDHAEANINRSPYLLINPVSDPASGTSTPMGPLGTSSPPQVPPTAAALLQVTASAIAELTTNNDNAEEVKSNVSAEAMDIAATRTDARTFGFIDNMRQSIQRTGEVYKSMAEDLYFEAGREVPTMDEDGQHGTAKLMDARMSKGVTYTVNDFAGTKMNVVADVTEATSTRRDKTVRNSLACAQAIGAVDPEGAQALVGLAIANMDGEGVGDFKDWNRQRMIAKGIVKPTPQELQAMQEQAQQQGQGQPSPEAQVIAAQTEKEQALTEKAKAGTEQTKAMTVKYLAEAHAQGREADLAAARTGLEAQQRDQEHRVSMLERLGKFFGTQAQGMG